MNETVYDAKFAERLNTLLSAGKLAILKTGDERARYHRRNSQGAPSGVGNHNRISGSEDLDNLSI
ncbi:hypothetical protein FF38_13282 [Lucilia cuprina]|uniref:Uncharacterized protein n=1 Tax=Lucilia cuprina TaxID=7375 RepID=A0A0L0CKE6_LUCCU|nr:hypothetical protein FF38_13282 [Lucilia cuprina]